MPRPQAAPGALPQRAHGVPEAEELDEQLKDVDAEEGEVGGLEEGAEGLGLADVREGHRDDVEGDDEHDGVVEEGVAHDGIAEHAQRVAKLYDGESSMP